MNTTMNASNKEASAAVMPLHTHWDSQQLADAVPLRLSQLIDFSVEALRACDRASANAACLRATRKSTTFLPTSVLAPFRMR